MKKLVVGSIVLMLVTVGWGDRSMGEQRPAPRGELRVVDPHPLNWAWLVYNVFEHLMELDTEGKLVPRLATSWQWRDDRTLDLTLRQGWSITMARSLTRSSSNSTGTSIPGSDSRSGWASL
jgi:hypothetical protein